jgi:hypothetical protein
VTFGAPGDYTTKLTGNDGATSVTASHTVTAASALSADYTATADISNPLLFNLQATASGGTGSYSVDWTTSDGQVPPAGATSSVTF